MLLCKYFWTFIIVLVKTKTITINLIILRAGTLKVTKPGCWQLYLFTFWFLTSDFQKCLTGAFIFRTVLLWDAKHDHPILPCRASSQRILTLFHHWLLNPLFLKDVMLLLIHLYSFFFFFWYSATQISVFWGVSKSREVPCWLGAFLLVPQEATKLEHLVYKIRSYALFNMWLCSTRTKKCTTDSEILFISLYLWSDCSCSLWASWHTWSVF